MTILADGTSALPRGRLTPVSDPRDPRIAVYRDVRERDVVGRENGFVAEGEVVLRVLSRSPRFRTRSLLLAQKRAERVASLIDAFDDDVAVYVADQAVMDAIAGFPMHRGILAFGERNEAASPDALLRALPARAVVLVLYGIANHDNIGGLFRNAAAFGVGTVLLDPTCCDPLYRKAIRVSVGGVLTVPFARLGEGEDGIDLLRRHGFESLALSPAGAVPLTDLTPPARAAVWLGAEGPGLPDQILNRARTVTIPMAGGFDSLNVATTSGIVLYHLTAAAGRHG